MSNKMSSSSIPNIPNALECENWSEMSSINHRPVIQNLPSTKMLGTCPIDNIYTNINEVNQDFSALRFTSEAFGNGLGGRNKIVSSCASPAGLSDSFSSLAPSLNIQFESHMDPREKNLNAAGETMSQIFPGGQTPSFVLPTVKSINSDESRQYRKISTEIVNDLESEDTDASFRSLYTLYTLLKEKNFRENIEYKDKIIQSLVNLLSRSSGVNSVSSLSAACIHYFSLEHENADFILNTNIMDLLNSFTIEDSEPILQYLVSSIHSIFIHIPSSRSFLTNFDKLKIFVHLLNFHRDEFTSISMDCLFICIKYIDVDFLIRETIFMKAIVSIIRERKHDKLLFLSCKLLKEILRKPTYRAELFMAGCFDALSKLLRPSSRRVAVLSLTILRNLSDACRLDYDYAEVIDILIAFVRNQLGSLRTSKLDIQNGNLLSCTLGILANIACNNPTNKRILIERQIILNIIELYHKTDIKEILECSFSILKHITCRHQMSKHACDQFIANEGMPILVDALQKCSKASLTQTVVLKKIIFGLLSNIATFDCFRTLFRELSLIQYVAHGLAGVMGHINVENMTLQVNINQKIRPGFVHDCNKILEASVITLYFISSDEKTLKMMISSHNLMRIFCKLLFTKSKTTLAYVILFFSVVSANSFGLKALEKAFNDVQGNEKPSSLENPNVCISRLKDIYLNITQSSSRHLFISMNKLLENLCNTCFQNELSTFILQNSQKNIMNTSNYNYESILDFSNMVDSPLNISPSLSRVSSQI